MNPMRMIFGRRSRSAGSESSPSEQDTARMLLEERTARLRRQIEQLIYDIEEEFHRRRIFMSMLDRSNLEINWRRLSPIWRGHSSVVTIEELEEINGRLELQKAALEQYRLFRFPCPEAGAGADDSEDESDAILEEADFEDLGQFSNFPWQINLRRVGGVGVGRDSTD